MRNRFEIRGIAALLEFPGMNFATQVVNPGGGGGAPSGGTDSGATGGGAPSGAPPSTGGGGSPQLNWQTAPAEFRTAYEAMKKEFDTVKGQWEPWSKVQFKPEQVTQFHKTYDAISREASTLGRNLGYSEEEIAAALAEYPIQTLDILREEAFNQGQGGGQDDGQQQQDGDLESKIQAGIEKAVGPIQQRENVRITNEANAIFERTVHGLASKDFQALGVDVSKVSQDEMDMLSSAVSEVMKYDEQGLWQLKYEGKTAGIQKAYNEAKTMLDKYFLARTSRENGMVRPGGGGGGQPPNRQGQPQPGINPATGKKYSIDELVEDAGRINPKYAAQ